MLYVNTNEIYDAGRPDNLAVMTAIEGIGFDGVRCSYDLENYAPRPQSGYFSRATVTAQATWLAERGLKLIWILGYGPPNNSYWQQLGGDWRHYNVTSEQWRAVRPPAGPDNIVWLAEAAAYQDMLDTIRAVYTLNDLDPDEYVIASYMNEPRNVTAATTATLVTGAGSSTTAMNVVSATGFSAGQRIAVLLPGGAEYRTISSMDAVSTPNVIRVPALSAAPGDGVGVGVTDSYANDGTIDTAFHSRAAVIVPILRAAFPNMQLASPTVWGVPATLQAYVDHWASNAAGSTAYAADFDLWSMNVYPQLQTKTAFKLSDVSSFMDELVNSAVAYIRAKAVLGMDTKPIGLHEFGLTPDEAGVGYFGRPDDDYVVGTYRRACCEAVVNNSAIAHGALYCLLNSAAMDASLTLRHGCIKITGDARSSLVPLMRMSGNDPGATVPVGYNNAGSTWAVQSGESQPPV